LLRAEHSPKFGLRYRVAVILAALVLLGLPFLASGHGYRLGDIRIIHPWATPSQATMGAGYPVLSNRGVKDDRLLSASSAIAARVELRAPVRDSGEPERDNGSLAAIVIPAGAETRLEPGGLHLQFIDLQTPLEDGRRFSVTLQFETTGSITVDMDVQQTAKDSIY
jgi:periplasmic copper chaperone A